jgi:hypothetical protein
MQDKEEFQLTSCCGGSVDNESKICLSHCLGVDKHESFMQAEKRRQRISIHSRSV